MPSERERENAGLRLLLRRDPLSKADWIQMVEAMRLFIKPYFDVFTLPTLGSVVFEGIGGRLHLFDPIYLEVFKADDGLKTNGIFFNFLTDLPQLATLKKMARIAGERFSYHLELKFLGLDRSGNWLKITIYCLLDSNNLGGRKPVAVSVKTDELEKILAETGQSPRQVWRQMCAQIRTWEKRHADLHYKAQYLSNAVGYIESAVALIALEQE